MDGLRLFARKHRFSEIRSGVHRGPTSAMNEPVIAYFQSWSRNRYLRKGMDLVLSWLLFPFKDLDAWLVGRTHDTPAGVFCVGRKDVP